MSIEQSDSNHTLPLTPTSSFRPPDMVVVKMTVSTVQPVVTSQVPTQVMTNISKNATNPFPMINSTTPSVGGHPTFHEQCGFDWRDNLVAV